ncbi:MAG: hypothetical protein AB3N63_02740 [Puniceicoccaceae bacterium]
MRKTVSSLILLTLLCSSISAQKWQNPGDRYANAYKDYMDADCPIGEDGMKHFVYFARDRGSMRGHAFLDSPRFSGAQIMYAWVHLEPSKGEYDFSIIEEDYLYLKSKGKKLFIQLQDTTFTPDFRATPGYLNTAEYDNGSFMTKNEAGHPSGWVANRTSKNVQERFALLLKALGNKFDGKIEGINLQETAAGGAFSPKAYVEAVKANMKAMKDAFQKSTTMQYANFMPGEWLPWEDEGYLRSIYEYGEEIGVSLGAPDLMPRRRGQLNHALAMMHENSFTVPLGIAIQDGNYTGMTGADWENGAGSVPGVNSDRRNIVPMLHGFAKDFLKVKYMFWVNQEPYFEEDVLPCFSKT